MTKKDVRVGRGWLAASFAIALVVTLPWTWGGTALAVGIGLSALSLGLAFVLTRRGGAVFARVLYVACALAIATCGAVSGMFVGLVDRFRAPLSATVLEPVEADYFYLRHPTEGWVVPRPPDGYVPMAEPERIEVALRMRGSLRGAWRWVDPATNARLLVFSSAFSGDPELELGYAFGAIESSVNERYARSHGRHAGEGGVWLDAEGEVVDGTLAATARCLRWAEGATNRMLVVVALHHPDDTFDDLLALAHAPGTPWLGPGPPLSGFTPPATTLRAARRLVASEMVPRAPVEGAPSPAIAPFERIDFPSDLGPMPAYLALAPESRGAVLWLHGGFTVGEEIGPGWGPAELVARGVSVLVPALRGEPGSPGTPELMLGELDDAAAALRHLAERTGRPTRDIVVTGHSSGGTLALLLAESGASARAFVALGPMADVSPLIGAPSAPDPPFLPRRPAEIWLRSPLHFLAGVTTPTLVMEGVAGNLEDLEQLRIAMPEGVPITLHVVPDGDHFSHVPAVAVRLAEVIDADGASIVEALVAIAPPVDLEP